MMRRLALLTILFVGATGGISGCKQKKEDLSDEKNAIAQKDEQLKNQEKTLADEKTRIENERKNMEAERNQLNTDKAKFEEEKKKNPAGIPSTGTPVPAPTGTAYSCALTRPRQGSGGFGMPNMNRTPGSSPAETFCHEMHNPDNATIMERQSACQRVATQAYSQSAWAQAACPATIYGVNKVAGCRMQGLSRSNTPGQPQVAIWHTYWFYGPVTAAEIQSHCVQNNMQYVTP